MNIKNIFNNPRKLHKIPNSMIIVENTKTRVFRYIPKKNIPFDSFEQKFDGSWLHILGCDLQGKLWPIDRENVDDQEITPTDVYVAKNCAEEVNEVYGLSMSMTNKIKLGIFVGLCILIVIAFIFIIPLA